MSGRVLILNGASSTGKSTIARAFRDRRAGRGEFWFHAGVDDVLAKVTHPWLDIGLPGGPGGLAADGLRVVDAEDGPAVEIGQLLERLLEQHQDWVGGMARSGVDVVVDECVLGPRVGDRWAAALAGTRTWWVSVSCDAAEARRREALRGDRPIGLSAAQSSTVHLGRTYDLALDTTDLAADLAVSRIESLVDDDTSGLG